MTDSMFTWIPIHRETIHRILEHRQRQKELLTVLREMEQQGLKVISLQDKGADGLIIPLPEIDPFTFLATFNRGLTDENRRNNWAFLKARWKLKAAIPDDFTGIPTLHATRAWLFPRAKDRKADHVHFLWEIATVAANAGMEALDPGLFNRCAKLKEVGVRRLAICLFWIHPEEFLPADHKTTHLGESKGVTIEPKDYQSYREWLKEMTEHFGNQYPQVSHEADLFAAQNVSKLDLNPEQMRFLWSRFHRVVEGFKDFQAPGKDFLDKETGYKRAILQKFQQELGAEQLSALVAKGQGLKAAKEIVRVLTSNLVSFRAWNATLGETDQAICDVLRECLKATSAPYQGPESTCDLFETFARNDLKPSWDALTVLLWALRPQDFFPVKISFYRELSTELAHELPSGRPDADKLHSLTEFGRAFWKALEPQKPSDWVDVQSFIWCVCPGTYGSGKAEGEQDGGALHEKSSKPTGADETRRYWTLSAGAGGEHWAEFCKKGIAAIGWDGTPDLRKFKSKEEIRQKLLDLWPGESSKKNDALACWQFAHDIEVGDIIFAKHGLSKLLGYGVVTSDYTFDATRSHYKHVRKVDWKAEGEWEMPEESRMASKTLTDVTPYRGFVELIASKVGLTIEAEPEPDAKASTVAYWWLNANPKIWNFEEMAVGQRQTYTSHNEKGNKRQKYRYFQEAKPGDVVVGYVTSPLKEVVALCKITKGLHQTGQREEIEIEKVEQLSTPVAYETLQANPDLEKSEPLISNQGSLFRLTEQEYEVIRSLIDEANVPLTADIETYDKNRAMKGLFLAENQFDDMLAALEEKKNLVLQGAPGVGKTYIARRLAYALIGSNDPQRIEIIQFHQSYSYEDFIQGFRPTPKGHFDLKYGIFHQFCRRAQREEAAGKPYVFIIDEINRGNLSKIFGELMMLIEPDKRGKEHSIPLAYSRDGDDKFYIPRNLHLIGMMNTADRSLAMVDYALRRRFRFISLRPEFSSEAFQSFLTDRKAKPELVKKIVSRMNALNDVITEDTKNLGPGYQIGHSYFCPRDGIKPDEDWYKRVIESEILPLVQEYWFDNDQKVKEQRSALLA